MEEILQTGTPLPNQLPTEYSFDPRNGGSVRRRYEMFNTQVSDYINNLQTAGLSFETRTNKGSPTTEVEVIESFTLGGVVPTPETVISEVWELLSNDLERSIWELPKVKRELKKFDSIVDGYSKAAYVHRLVDGKLAGSSTVVGYGGNEVDIITHEAFTGEITALGLDAAVFTGLVRTLAKGVEAFPVSGYVIRRTKKLPAVTNIKPILARSNIIYEKSVFIALENPPSTITFGIPEGWYQKKSPVMAQQQDGTWQMTEEWWWAEEFEAFIYDSFFPL